MVECRFALISDIDALVPLMRDFCAFEHIPFDESRRRELLTQLIADTNKGALVLMEDDGVLVGYFVLGFGFSIEFGGRDALLDELYVIPGHRHRGIGSAALEHAYALCRSFGIACLHLEADYFNDRAHQLYLRQGFKDHERHLMTKWL
jgi:GNAT superfamily N-acetyltransferase